MFIVNQSGRIVGLPENMEESGFHQAAEVLSISSSLMNIGEYMVEAGRGTLRSESGKMLRNQILAKFPDVITDEEYLAKSGKKEAIPVKSATEVTEEPVIESDVPEQSVVIKRNGKTIEDLKKTVEALNDIQEDSGPKEIDDVEAKILKELEEEVDDVGEVGVVSKKLPINEGMLKEKILDVAAFYHIPLSSREKNSSKAKLIKAIDEKYNG